MAKLYKVSCYSTCGTYFSSYLQSATVVAENKEQALTYVREWLATSGQSFIYPEDKWEVDTICTVAPGIVDYHYGSDY